MKILITGATGFIGKHLVNALLSQGHEIGIIARNKEKALQLFGQKVAIYHGDIRSWSTYTKIPKSYEYIFHLAAVISHKKEDTQTVFSTNVHGTKLLLLFATGLPNLKQFIHISSIAVYGAANKKPATEESLRLPKSPYEVSKNISEKMVKKTGNQFEIPYTIIRPPVVFGEWDESSAIIMIEKLVKRNIYTSITSNPVTLQTISITDLIEGILRTLSNQKAINQDFIMVGPVVTLEEIAAFFLDQYKKNKLPGFLPKPMLYMLSHVFSDPHSIYFLLSNRRFSALKAKKLLGFSAKTSLQEGLESAKEWYLN